jgi:acetylornithine/succinyldiaminopimelate/putrescine aminotransferase
MNLRELFLQHVAQTSVAPMALEIVKADGCVLTDAAGKQYLDLIGGISVANIGHRHPSVVKAIQQQLEAYLHVMVYGEFVQSPQVRYATRLTEHLPQNLNSVYFTNSGAEAVEGAMKLTKRVTGRTKLIGFHKAYHGSTQGALSILGDEYWRNSFRPLLPGILHLDYNSMTSIDAIDRDTAAVFVETVQAESGVTVPEGQWMTTLRARCNDTGTLLVLDEVQAGFGRTGSLWAFEQYGVIPDILILGKALGGGLPLGAFIGSKEMMDKLTNNPVLGHITTFGGHPLCCAAGLAAFEVLLSEKLYETAAAKGALFKNLLYVGGLQQISQCGLWLAIHFEDFAYCKKVIDRCIEQGLVTDWFLFSANSMRISPPLTISEEEIRRSCSIILQACA